MAFSLCRNCRDASVDAAGGTDDLLAVYSNSTAGLSAGTLLDAVVVASVTAVAFAVVATVAVVATGAVTILAVRWIVIKRRGDVVHGVQEDCWQQPAPRQDQEKAIHVASAHRENCLEIDQPGYW